MPFQTTLFLASEAATGSSSNFTVCYNPPIELDAAKTYELALISANIWRSWHNITPKNNKFRYSPSGDGSAWVDLSIPPGAYNITDINVELRPAGSDPELVCQKNSFLKVSVSLGGFGPSVAHGKHSVRRRCAGITCHLNHNGRRRAKRPRTLALASLLSSLSSLQDSRDFSSPRKDLVLGRDGGIGT